MWCVILCNYYGDTESMEPNNFTPALEVQNTACYASFFFTSPPPCEQAHICSTNQRISNLFAARTSEFQTYLQHKQANFKLTCSTNQRISNSFAAQTSEFQTYLQHEPANFKLICGTNQQISNLFAAQTSELQTYLQHKPANCKLICSTNQWISASQPSFN